LTVETGLPAETPEKGTNREKGNDQIGNPPTDSIRKGKTHSS